MGLAYSPSQCGQPSLVSTFLIVTLDLADRQGLDTYRGHLRHSGTWDAVNDQAQSDFDWKDMRVAVIGNVSDTGNVSLMYAH